MKKIGFLIISTVLLCSCATENKNKEKEPAKIGKYLYMELDSTLHIDQECIGLTLKSLESKNFGLKYIDTAAFYSTKPNYKYCKECFNDKLYEQMKDMIQRNSNINNLLEDYRYYEGEGICKESIR